MARASQPQARQKQQKTNAGNPAGNPTASSPTGAIEMLRQDHRKVEQLFQQFEQSSDDEQKEGLVDKICAELIIHTRLEEELFYAACRDAGVEEDKLDESQVEHDGAKMLINDLLEAHSDSDYFSAKVSVLKEMIKHHVAEEEEPGDGVFAQAKEHQIDDAGLGQRMARRKQELQQRGVGRRPARPVDVGMGGLAEGTGGRDIYGYGGDDRFRGENARGYGERQRFDEDEYDGGYDRSGRRSPGYEADWNEGRYGASREQQNHGRRYEEDDRRFRAPYDDRDEDRHYGRGQGGWFGDPRGHSEASRHGWEERRSDDDRRRYGRARRGDDGDHRGRGEHGGWFGDSRAHAEASRRGWQHRR
jgi:hypothetical protein